MPEPNKPGDSSKGEKLTEKSSVKPPAEKPASNLAALVEGKGFAPKGGELAKHLSNEKALAEAVLKDEAILRQALAVGGSEITRAAEAIIAK